MTLMENEEKKIICPGDTLMVIMENNGLSKQDLADKTGVKYDYVEAICQGVGPIRSFYAKKLEEVLHVDSQFWMNLQSLYENELKIYGKFAKQQEAFDEEI
jgi:plasmid maintenance system antidote protein VapI